MKKKKIFSGNIDDIAEENNYYSLEGLANKYEWENEYSQVIEPEFKNILDKIIKCAQNNEVFPAKYNFDLSRSLFFQFLRCGYARQYSKEMIIEPEKKNFLPYINLLLMNRDKYRDKNNKYHNIFYDEDNRLNSPEKIYSLIGDIVYKDIALAQYGNNTLYNYFCKRKYVIYRIKTKRNFITCDDPVLLININNYDSEKFRNGLIDINTAIIFPINPKILAVSYHEKNELYRLSCKIIDLDNSEKNISFINNINKSIFKHSRNFAISQDKSSLEIICSELEN